jgi:hypothetical protein
MTSDAVLARPRALAPTLPDHQIAARLNTDQVPTATGKLWTAKRVRSMRVEHGIASGCPVDPAGTPCRGDGLVSVRRAAHLLQVSPALIHVWIGHGVLAGDQRVAGSYRWVRLTEDDRRRLQGEARCTQFPSLREVARERGCTAEAVWDLVRAGEFVPYRHRAGEQWEWRLQRRQPGARAAVASVQ